MREGVPWKKFQKKFLSVFRSGSLVEQIIKWHDIGQLQQQR